MWRELGNHLAQRVLVSAPALWGKLPSHGDFVRYRVNAQASHAWGEWVDQQWSRRPDRQGLAATKPSRRELRDGPSRFTHLQASPARHSLREVPVAFILPPSAAAFSKGRFVQGVWVPSEDRSGRSCPLIVYQTVSARWMWQTTLSDLHPSPGVALPRHWLFWLGRLVAAVGSAQPDLNRLCQTLDALWAPRAPNWSQLMGAAARVPTPRDDEDLIQQLGADATLDPARGLQGVAHLPWPDWPQTLVRQKQPLPAYWQQDPRGGYVNAAHQLDQLWRAHT